MLRTARGLSLIELLIAMATGLVVVGAGLSFLVGASGAASAHLLRVRLHQDFQSVVDALSRDLMRAGAWALADEVAQAQTRADLLLSGTEGSISADVVARDAATPAQVFGFGNAAAALRGATLVLLQHDGTALRRHDLAITGVPAPDRLTLSIPEGTVLAHTRAASGSWTILNPFAGVHVDDTGSCVLLRYDLDGNGVLDDEEHFGFRLDAARRTIQTTTTARECTRGNWDAFTDPAHLHVATFEVRRLGAPRTAAAPIAPAVHAYRLTLGGRLTRDRAATRTLEHLVQPRNPVLE